MRHSSFASLAFAVAIAMNCWTADSGHSQEQGSRNPQVDPAAEPDVGQADNAGMVLVDNEWKTPEAIAAENETNRKLNSYVSIRKQAANTFEGQCQIANWCNSRNLIEQRNAHLKRALSFNPESVEVRNLLGHVNVDGTWFTEEQIATQQKKVAEANQRFIDFQKPVTEIANYLVSGSKKRQKIGLDRLSELNDPRSITALEVILAASTEPVAMKAVETIGRFSEREATESLLRISMFNRWATVQQKSLELLALRNRYDYVPALMNQLLTPFTTRRAISTDSQGNVLYQYILHQRDMSSDAVRQFDLVLLQNPGSDNDLRPNLEMDASLRSFQADMMVLQTNANIQSRNRSIQSVLNSTTGVNPGSTPDDWWRWWYDENEVTLYERPVSYTRVRNTEMTVPYMRPRSASEPAPITSGRTRGASGECLVAGTMIWTERGPLPVETLMIGDRVLCQDTDTQKLEFRAVLQPTVRPPTATFQMWLDDEIVQASGGHMFWVDIQGWTKVRDLEPGMYLTSATGTPVKIEKLEPGETVELFNLIVDRHSNYFVGASQVLSHDSTILARGEKSVEHSSKE